MQEGDFTFVYGCPGSTQEYVMSEQVKYVSEVSDPQKIALRTQRLDIQKTNLPSTGTSADATLSATAPWASVFEVPNAVFVR